MLRHIVMFRRKRDVAPDAALESALTARMSALGADIPAISSWRFARNELDRPVCWEYVLEAETADAEALDAYLFHPLHQELVLDLRQYFEWAAVDYTA